jgi:hypothetical protein
MHLPESYAMKKTVIPKAGPILVVDKKTETPTTYLITTQPHPGALKPNTSSVIHSSLLEDSMALGHFGLIFADDPFRTTI